MVNIEESLARGQLVRLFNLFQSSDCQEHADRRTQGEEIHWLKVQRVVDHWHLQNKTLIKLLLKSNSESALTLSLMVSHLPVQCQLQSNCSRRGWRRQCCPLEASSQSDQQQLQLLVGAPQPDWPLLSSPGLPVVLPASRKPRQRQKECVSHHHRCKQASQALQRQTHLLVHSFFDELGDLFPGTQWDSHLFQVLNRAHELKEWEKGTKWNSNQNPSCYQITSQILAIKYIRILNVNHISFSYKLWCLCLHCWPFCRPQTPFIISKRGFYSYKRFNVNPLLIKGTLVLRQAQMLQHSRKILKLLPVFFGLLFHSWRGDGIISLCNGGCHLRWEVEFTIMYCHVILKLCQRTENFYDELLHHIQWGKKYAVFYRMFFKWLSG